jgi:hypothetical protein
MERAKADAVEKVAPLKTARVAKIAARAASTSTRLENRAVPTGHVRSRGVKSLLAERQARKR